MKRILLVILVCFTFTTCKKDGSINPYNNSNLGPPSTNDTNYFSDPTAFAALHNNIFIPT